MKILKLNFKNLNSLYGHWEIDFTNKAYLDNGLFALTGSTGSGKSTILDAICLALYARTPRLAKVNSSENGIMSLQTSECFSEVTFQTEKGTYTSRFEQRRAHNSAMGNLQAVSHKVFICSNRKPLADRSSEAVRINTDLTGMDFDRFTRASLLAQGGFDSFLKSGPEDKSSILEKITGTKIYSEISMYVQKEHSEKMKKYKNLEESCAQVVCLTDEDLTSLKSQVAALDEKINAVNTAIELDKDCIVWLNHGDELRTKIANNSDNKEKNKTDLENFKPQAQVLAQYENTLQLQVPYTKLCELKKTQHTELQKLSNLNSLTKTLEKNFNNANVSLESAQAALSGLEDEEKKLTVVFNKVRKMDAELKNLDENVKKAQSVLALEKEKEEKLKAEQQALEEEKKSLENQKVSLEQYLKDHASDSELISSLSSIEQAFRSLDGIKKELSFKIKEIEVLTKDQAQLLDKQKKAQMAVTSSQNEHDSKKKQVEDALEQQKILLDNYPLDYYKQTLALNRKLKAQCEIICSLEEHRSKLKDGCECPLCGAKNHPFAKGNVPKKGEYDDTIRDLETRINDIETATIKHSNLQSELSNTSLRLEKEKSSLEIIKNNLEQKNNELKKENGELLEKQSLLDQNQKQLIDKLVPFGIQSVNIDVNKVLEKLTEKKNKYEKALNDQKSLSPQLATNDANSLNHSRASEECIKNIEQYSKDLEEEQKAHDEKKNARIELFSNKDPDQEEKKLKEKLFAAQKAKDLAVKEQNSASNSLNNNTLSIKELSSTTKEREDSITKDDDNFNRLLKEKRFDSLEAFKNACLSEQQAATLKKQKQELEDCKLILENMAKDLCSQLQEHVKKDLTKENQEVISSRILQNQNQNETDKQELVKIQAELLSDKNARDKYAGLKKELEDAKADVELIEQLNTLIGSSDGKKFRNYAQGLTFEIMVNYANSHLSSMSDRYQLIQDESNPLILRIVDNYEGGVVRTVANLSGGESFIISLSLAIGLSKMSSKNVRVDSLFLDEGFGTLDDESLNTAISTLASLHDEGKLIGVISHVAALQDNIGTRIEVSPQGLGHSSLSGPGVSFKNDK